ncbi:MAG: hypothetical protein QOH79_3285 [Acidimicrobiaceae bacterium]
MLYPLSYGGEEAMLVVVFREPVESPSASS